MMYSFAREAFLDGYLGCRQGNLTFKLAFKTSLEMFQ